MSWFMMTALGGLLMWAMRWTNNRILDGVLVRLAAVFFVGAGAIGATGWVGSTLTTSTSWVVSITNGMGSEAVGEGVVWVLAAGLGLMWVMAMIPGKQCRFDYPDWLVIGGLLLPSLLSSVPGQLGLVLRQVITVAGQWAQTIGAQVLR